MIVHNKQSKNTNEHERLLGLFIINSKKLVFYTVFILVFLLSGILVMQDIVPYRMNLVSLIVLPLLFLIYGIQIDRVFMTVLLLTLIIIVSAAVNQVSIVQLLLFLRSALFAFLIYSLVRLTLTVDNIAKVIRICVVVAMIQLPIVLLQFMTYDRLPSRITIGMNLGRVDYSFGTFHFKGDPAMAFFLTLLVVFLLFDHKRNYIIRHKWPVVFWLTLTVLVTNSELMKLAMIIVWSVYAIRYFSIRTLLFGTITFTFLASILLLSGALDEIIHDFSYSVASNLSTSDAKTESFLSGGYGRGAAIAFYLNNDLELIGDGPSRYYDVVTQTRIRGNTGHIFTYYSEVGLIGLLTSYLIFFFIAFPIREGRIRVRWVGVLILAIILLLSITSEVLSDISHKSSCIISWALTPHS